MDLELQKTLFDTNGDEIANYMKKLNISQRMLDESLDQLENWFKLQPHLPDISRDDPHVIKTLCVMSFSIEKTKKKIENLYTARSVASEFFANREAMNEYLERCAKCFQPTVMPKITKNNCRLIIGRMISDLVDLCVPLEWFKLASMILDMRLQYDTNFNDVYIVDMSNFKLGHVLKMQPFTFKNNLLTIQKSYIGRVVAVHFVNVPHYGIDIIKFFKSLLKKKISERFHVHDNLESLYDHISREDLPVEFGGDAGYCYEISENLLNAMKTSLWRSRLIEICNMKSDESKRPKKSNLSEEFGMIGSFRNLDID